MFVDNSLSRKFEFCPERHKICHSGRDLMAFEDTNMKRNKASYRFFMLLLLCLISFSETLGQDVKVNWTVLKTAFQKFVEYPSSENASHVILLLPEKHIEYRNSPEEEKTILYIFDAENFGMLDRQVISRNREAVRLAFRLHSIADGAFTEELNIMLGTLIRIDPKLFLEELNLANPVDNLWNDLLGNFGPEFVDRFKAQSLEIKLRIHSLKSVTEPSLIKIRDKCINTYSYLLTEVNKIQK
jgi:hypothetical protein